MRDLKQWALPAVTVLAVLGAVLLPRQISSLRDRSMLGAIHTEALSQEDLSVRELPLPEKLELLGRAIRYPDLEIFSTGTARSGRPAGVGGLLPKRGIAGRLGHPARRH